MPSRDSHRPWHWRESVHRLVERKELYLSLQLHSSRLTRHSTCAVAPWLPLPASSRFLFARPACFATVMMHTGPQRHIHWPGREEERACDLLSCCLHAGSYS
jgi:hypothetical protein